jgi:hypothetical protein
MKRIIITSFFVLIIGLIPPIALYTWDAYARSNSDIARDIQLLLSLKGIYTGQLNGLCDVQTLQAIEKYGHTLTKTPTRIECSSQFLESLKNDMSAILAADTLPANRTAAQKSDATNEVSSISTRLAALETNNKNTNAAVKGISDSLSAYFVTQFDNLASIGVSAFATAIAIIIAFTALIGNLFIKDTVRAAHDQELDKAKSEHAKMLKLATTQLSANIYTAFGAHCINLYKDIPDPVTVPHRKNMYESYLDIAVHMTQRGYGQALELFKTQTDKPSIEQEDTMTVCLNNYAYFLAERSAQEHARAQEDKVKLGQLLPELERISVAKGKKSDWWAVKDTLVWAQLHLDHIEGQAAKAIIEEIINDSSVPEQFKEETRKRYIFFNKFPQNARRKVELFV